MWQRRTRNFSWMLYTSDTRRCISGISLVCVKKRKKAHVWCEVLTKNVRLMTTSIVLVQTEPQTTDEQPRRRSSSLCPPQQRRRHTVPTTSHRPASAEPARTSKCATGTALSIPSSIIAFAGHVVRRRSYEPETEVVELCCCKIIGRRRFSNADRWR